MAELSSVLFLDTDELGRPTGLVASEDTDTIASAIMPPSVKDTVLIVQDADVSNNYTAWNTVSSVSGLGEISGVLTALPGEFENLEASVADISTVVETFDPNTILSVSSSVFNNSGTWNQAYTYIDAASGDIRDTSSAVIGADSGLSALALSSSQLSTAIDSIPIGGQVPADVSNNWQGTYIYTLNASDNISVVSSYVFDASGDIKDTSNAVIGADSGLSSLETSTANLSSILAASAAALSTAIDNVPTGGSIPTDVSAPWQSTFIYTNGASGNIGNTSAFVGGTSGLLEDGSGILSGLSGVIPGTTDGPDVPMFSALSAIAQRIRIVDDGTLIDAMSGQTILLSGASKVTTRATTMSIAGANDGSFLKLQPNIGYISALSAGLVAPEGGDIIIARQAQGAATITSSLLGLYAKTSDNSGGWQASYDYVGGASGNIGNTSAFVGGASGNIGNTSAYVGGASGNIGNVSAYVGGASATIKDVSTIVEDGSGVLADISGVDKQLSATTLTLLGNTNINIGPAAGNTSSLIPIIADLASVSGTGGGGGGGVSSIASAILVSDGSAVDVNIAGTPENNTTLVLDTENQKFNYKRLVFELVNGIIRPGDNLNANIDFGGGTSRNFTTSGATKTLLEFDDKSRVALGRNSVPLEISAFGESDVRLEDDGTNGAFVLIKGSKPGDVPNISKVHLESADLSADSDSAITFASDITVATSSVEDTFAGLSGAITDKVTLSEGNQTITGNRTVDDGNNGYFYLLDMEDSGKKSQVFLNPATPSVQVVANDTGAGNITGFTAGSTNLNLTFTGAADLRLNAAPGSSGEVLTSNGAGSAPTWQTAGGGGGGTTIELLSAGFSGTGSIPTSAGSLLTWDAPVLNTASVTYAAGEFTIPAGINGYYCEINAMAGGDSGNARVELELELLKDTGSGYVEIAAGDNYAVRTVTQDEGGVWLNFLDPTALATGDKYKFQFRRVGGGLNHKPLATKLAMKFYSP